MLKCLCENPLNLNKAKLIEIDDPIYEGNTDNKIGYIIKLETVCEKCKKELCIEISIYDKNW